MALSRRPQGAAPAPSSSSSSAAGSAVYVGVAASGGAHAYPQMPPAALFARGAAAGASAPAAAPAHLDSSGYLSADDGCGFPSAGAPPSAGGGAAFVDEHTLMSAAAECLGIIAAVPAASSTDLAGLLVEKAALKVRGEEVDCRKPCVVSQLSSAARANRPFLRRCRVFAVPVREVKP